VGTDGQGAIVNSSGADEQDALQFLTLAGDTAIGGHDAGSSWPRRAKLVLWFPGSWGPDADQSGAKHDRLRGHCGHELRHHERGERDLVYCPDNSGWSDRDQYRPEHTPIAAYHWIRCHSISATGGKILLSGGASTSTTLWSPVAFTSGLTVDTATTPGTFTNTLSGSGTLTKLGTSVLTLEAPSSATGGALISAGTLRLGPAATLTTPSIDVASGATLNVTNVAGFALASGQTLQGSGTVVGNVAAGSGTTIVPGASPERSHLPTPWLLNGANLAFELGTPASTIGGGVNDLITADTLALSGVNNVTILPLTPLDTSGNYTLFTYTTNATSTNFTGLASNLSVANSSRYTFTVVDPATTVPYVQIQASGAAGSLTWQGGDTGSPTRLGYVGDKLAECGDSGPLLYRRFRFV